MTTIPFSSPVTVDELLAGARIVSLPLATKFRGITERELVLFDGPEGAAEFSPFVEYDDRESAAWLQAAIEFGWQSTPALLRDRIAINATVPAIAAAEVAALLARFDGARTAKVKVAERGQTLNDDIARVREVRRVMGAEGRIRLDANGAWNVDEAEHAFHALAEFDLEYVEQPCSTLDELSQIRERTHYLDVPIAADESVRKAEDPLAVARAGAADLLVVKVQPLGGITSTVAIAHEAGLPVIVSSALESSVGLSMGAHCAAALPELFYDCGLGTASLLSADVTRSPLVASGGSIAVSRVDVDDALVTRWAASPERTAWWHDRIRRTFAALTA